MGQPEMSRPPRVDLLAAPAGASDLVLLAHGGEVDSVRDPHSWRAAILRMWPFAVAARASRSDAAVGLMRYRYRGWNGEAAAPAADLRLVLDRLPEHISRVALIGHSMGGRAVVAAGNHPKVAGVLALAPWLPTGEPLSLLAESASAGEARPVVLAHGRQGRITDLALTAAFARRLREGGMPTGCLDVSGERHAMLQRSADWNELVGRFVRHAIGPGDLFIESVLSSDPGRVDELPHWNRRGTSADGVRDIAFARLRLRVIDQL